MAEVEQKLQPSGQPTDGITVAAVSPSPWPKGTPIVRASNADTICGCRTGAPASSPRKPRNHATPSPATTWSASITSPSPGRFAMWPPTTIVAFGWCRRTSSHMSFTLPMFGRMPLIPTTSYGTVRISSSKRSRVGKSRSVVGASRFAWMSIRPHERWNMRSENGPCTRVTWLWYSSIGLIARLPCSSSRA